MRGEWSLVAFTIAGQFAAGFYLIAGIPVYLDPGEAGAWLGRVGGLEFLADVLVLLAIAAALSLFHLHRPVKAYLALANLGKSWLSREILALALFAAATGTLTICEWRGVGGPGLLRALFILGGLGAVLLLLTMSRLYMLPSVPSWNRAYTPVSFLLTAMALGAVSVACLISFHGGVPSLARPFLILSLCALVGSFASSVLIAPVHGVFGARPRPSVRPPVAGSALLHAARLFLLAAGGLMLAAILAAAQGRGPGVGHAPVMLALGFVLITAGEVCGRFLFYGLSGQRN